LLLHGRIIPFKQWQNPREFGFAVSVGKRRLGYTGRFWQEKAAF
jgi:hypothetical protein